MYVCMVIACSKGMDQPGKVSIPARDQLNRENYFFPVCPRSRLRISSRETGSAVPSRASLLISALRLNLVLTHGTPPKFRGSVPFIYLNRVWDARLSMLDCHLVEGVWYIYDWDTGWLVLMW